MRKPSFFSSSFNALVPKFWPLELYVARPPRFVCGFTSAVNTLGTIEVGHDSPSKTRKCELVREWRSAPVSRIDSGCVLWLAGAGDARRGPKNRYERFAVAQLTGVRHRQNVLERQPMHFEDLVLFGTLGQRGQLRGEEQMNDFCQNAG